MSSKECCRNEDKVNNSTRNTKCCRKRLSDFSIDYILGIKGRKESRQESPSHSTVQGEDANLNPVPTSKKCYPQEAYLPSDSSRLAERRIPSDIEVHNANIICDINCQDTPQLRDQMHPHIPNSPTWKKSNVGSERSSRTLWYFIPRSANPPSTHHHCDNITFSDFEIEAQRYLKKQYQTLFYPDLPVQLPLHHHQLPRFPTFHLRDSATVQAAAQANPIVHPSLYSNQYMYLPFPC